MKFIPKHLLENFYMAYYQPREKAKPGKLKFIILKEPTLLQHFYLKNNRLALHEFFSSNIDLGLKDISFTILVPSPSISFYLSIIYHHRSTYLFSYLPTYIAYTHITFIYIILG